jgi:2-oxoisovalerate dehydrogenase E1 component
LEFLWRDAVLPLGKGRVYDASGDDQLTIVTFGNGRWMSLRVAKRLRERGIKVRVFDLRWLAPMPIEQVMEHAKATGCCLVVDECRSTRGGPSPRMLTQLCQDPELAGCVLRRKAAVDSHVPPAAPADLVLVQEPDIQNALLALCERPVLGASARRIGQRRAPAITSCRPFPWWRLRRGSRDCARPFSRRAAPDRTR